MNNNQINGQKNNKEAYCPNPIFNNGTVSIGEFKTIEDAMNFPMQVHILQRWFIGSLVQIRFHFCTNLHYNSQKSGTRR